MPTYIPKRIEVTVVIHAESIVAFVLIAPSKLKSTCTLLPNGILDDVTIVKTRGMFGSHTMSANVIQLITSVNNTFAGFRYTLLRTLKIILTCLAMQVRLIV